jgi:hypothetical protein
MAKVAASPLGDTGRQIAVEQKHHKIKAPSGRKSRTGGIEREKAER